MIFRLTIIFFCIRIRNIEYKWNRKRNREIKICQRFDSLIIWNLNWFKYYQYFGFSYTYENN